MVQPSTAILAEEIFNLNMNKNCSTTFTHLQLVNFTALLSLSFFFLSKNKHLSCASVSNISAPINALQYYSYNMFNKSITNISFQKHSQRSDISPWPTQLEDGITYPVHNCTTMRVELFHVISLCVVT